MPKKKIDGININYRIVGDGPHTVLCLPGYLGTIDLDFGTFFEKADKTKFRWVCWDPPGYGESFPPKREFKRGYLQRDADLVWQLMEALNFETYSVVGWSQGGATGIFLTADNPDSVKKLVTIGTEAALNQSSVRVYNAMKNIDFWPPENLQKQLKHHKKAYLESITQEMSEYCIQINKYDKGEYLRKAPENIKCPVLVVHGSDDTTSAVGYASDLQNKIKNSELVFIQGAKHDPHLTHTEEFIPILEKFLLA